MKLYVYLTRNGSIVFKRVKLSNAEEHQKELLFQGCTNITIFDKDGNETRQEG